MQQKLTDTKMRNFKARDKLIKLSDGGSLFVHVQPNGTKRFVMAYRFEGKQRSLSIGVYPDVSLTEARQARNEAKELLKEGIDPNKAKQKKACRTPSCLFMGRLKNGFLFTGLARQI